MIRSVEICSPSIRYVEFVFTELNRSRRFPYYVCSVSLSERLGAHDFLPFCKNDRLLRLTRPNSCLQRPHGIVAVSCRVRKLLSEL